MQGGFGKTEAIVLYLVPFYSFGHTFSFDLIQVIDILYLCDYFGSYRM